MLEVIYYVACSLDGFIATADGGVDWLDPYQRGDEDYGYAEFYSSVEALLLGSRTYEVSLRLGEWPAPDKPSWVFTRRELPIAHPSVTLTSEDPAEVVATLRERGLKRAWLMGGGELAASFRTAGLITRCMIFVVPIVLGGGVRLFVDAERPSSLELVGAKPYSSGLVQLDYGVG
jgi:dihydrofolate reductase